MKLTMSSVATFAAGLIGTLSFATVVDAAPAVKLNFATTPQTVQVNTCSGAVRVRPEDASGNVVIGSKTRSVALSGRYFNFYSNSTCTKRVTSVAIAAGAQGRTFYFKNTRTGSRRLKAASSGLTSALQTQSIVAKQVTAPTPTPTPAPTPLPTPVPTPQPTPTPPVGLRPIPNPIYGVTTDSVANLSDLVKSLGSLSQRPTTRVVFDEFVAASYYKTPVNEISKVSYVMGELLDSFYMKQYSVDQYKARTTEYLNTLGDTVDIWEVGNEINGEWLGDIPSVVAKMTGAYDIVKSRGKRTALTLYYNEQCWRYPTEEMFDWAAKNVPDRMKKGLDYVWVSFYEDDCNGIRPDWVKVFNRLATIFPNSKIGFGEAGTTDPSKKAEYINRYYNMVIPHPNYVGGYFWWYFRQDMVPMTKANWSVLNEAIRN